VAAEAIVLHPPEGTHNMSVHYILDTPGQVLHVAREVGARIEGDEYLPEPKVREHHHDDLGHWIIAVTWRQGDTYCTAQADSPVPLLDGCMPGERLPEREGVA
jgi:hypothetical protein